MGQALAHATSYDRNEVAEVFDPCGCIDKDVAICISICVSKNIEYTGPTINEIIFSVSKFGKKSQAKAICG